MKAVLVAVALLALPVSTRAAEIDPAAIQLWDVVYTNDGTVLKGVIVEEIPGTSLRVLLVGGSSIVVPNGNVVRITRELNPGFTQAAQSSASATDGARGSAGRSGSETGGSRPACLRTS